MDRLIGSVVKFLLAPSWWEQANGNGQFGSSVSSDASKDLPFVIGAGLCRTGTHSLQAALLALGYNKPYHMRELLEHQVPMDPWIELALNERETGTKNKTLALMTAQSVIDQGFMATTDAPCCLLYPEFLELTDGKVILTVRSSASDWRKSVLDTVGRLPLSFFKPPFTFYAFTRNFAGVLDPWVYERIGGIAELGQMDVPKESVHDYEGKLESAYTQWIENVKEQVPPEKLLVHHPKDGYPPLCEFLGIKEEDCPKEDYPHIADTDTMKLLIRSFEVTTEGFFPVVGLMVLLPVIIRKSIGGKKGGASNSKGMKSD
ncbi:expressed unknown protein [Seminavis robusta]|uniref:P-loop containing nucleoside triphosphate hydrolase protein n=1 Tax=Seminavis robusta TaxID=568900 RepID=A0A9N8HYJ5_9STRA|nr:expressed unknown protein [Seminavis robusta]|eukprot:Sro2526_g330270.1 n/a (317) ;mRNA; r:4647-5597